MTKKGDDNEGPSFGIEPADVDPLGSRTIGSAHRELASQHSIAEELRRATGSFGLHETASDRLMRELNRGSLIDRAMRDAIGGTIGSDMAALFSKSSADELAGTRAHALAAGLIGGFADQSLLQQAGGTVAGAAREATKAIEAATARMIGLDTAAAWAKQSIGTTAAESLRAAGKTRYVDDGLASSVASLRSNFSGTYESILREIADVGSLGSIAAGLATRPDMLGRSSRLFDEVAANAELATTSSASAALRRACADFFPPLRPASRSEIDAIMAQTSGWIALAPYPVWRARAQEGIGGLASAWVREDRPDLSLEAMTRFGHLGGLVANVDPQDASVTAELRARLGDYRTAETSGHSSDDPLLRIAEQYDRGFDPTFSSLPTQVVIAMLAPFGLRFDAEAAEEEFGLQDLIGQMLRRIEGRLMSFIRTKLEDEYGDEWILHSPSEIRSQLRRRRRNDEKEGRTPSDLIAYADFASWGDIVGHGENWGLFASTFGSLDALHETLARIKPIRHAASHPRVLGPEDLFTLAADGTRLLRWLGAIH
jgi:hypothetical protein